MYMEVLLVSECLQSQLKGSLSGEFSTQAEQTSVTHSLCCLTTTHIHSYSNTLTVLRGKLLRNWFFIDLCELVFKSRWAGLIQKYVGFRKHSSSLAMQNTSPCVSMSLNLCLSKCGKRGRGSSETSDRVFVAHFCAINRVKMHEILWRLRFWPALPLPALKAQAKSQIQSPEQTVWGRQWPQTTEGRKPTLTTTKPKHSVSFMF